jgi:hypothetical protein
VDAEPVAAYVSRDSPLELTVNFGFFVGRNTCRAEIETLGEMLLALVSGVTVVAGQRYEFAQGAAESSAHEVKIQFPPFILPIENAELEPLVDLLLDTARRWAGDCAATAPAEGEDLAARIARAAAQT